MATETKLLTAEDLLRMHSQGVRGELLRGVLCNTMPTGREHGEIAANTAYELLNHVKPRKLGIVTTSDSGVRLERDPDTVREPDVAFFLAQRIGPERVTTYSDVVPDLVVEIVSPNDDAEKVYDKARMWLSFGVRLVWVANPDSPTVAVHRPARAVDTAS
ncbi:MAG: Uma2 family endonuclease, partial [Chloroflexi bacterium]|nr:Uma2 family endonuclease [Chloroflexota bacterium]